MIKSSIAFEEGYDAFTSGLPCPYARWTDEYHDWICGYNYASGSPDPYSDEARDLGLHNIGDDD